MLASTGVLALPVQVQFSCQSSTGVEAQDVRTFSAVSAKEPRFGEPCCVRVVKTPAHILQWHGARSERSASQVLMLLWSQLPTNRAYKLRAMAVSVVPLMMARPSGKSVIS